MSGFNDDDNNNIEATVTEVVIHKNHQQEEALRFMKELQHKQQQQQQMFNITTTSTKNSYNMNNIEQFDNAKLTVDVFATTTTDLPLQQQEDFKFIFGSNNSFCNITNNSITTTSCHPQPINAKTFTTTCTNALTRTSSSSSRGDNDETTTRSSTHFKSLPSIDSLFSSSYELSNNTSLLLQTINSSDVKNNDDKDLFGSTTSIDLFSLLFPSSSQQFNSCSKSSNEVITIQNPTEKPLLQKEENISTIINHNDNDNDEDDDEEKKNYITDSITDVDVLLGRGGRTNHHPGNAAYLHEKEKIQKRYMNAMKEDKKAISQELVNIINNKGGRFLKLDNSNNQWYIVDNTTARKKAAQTLREINTPEVRAAKRAKYNYTKNTKKKKKNNKNKKKISSICLKRSYVIK